MLSVFTRRLTLSPFLFPHIHVLNSAVNGKETCLETFNRSHHCLPFHSITFSLSLSHTHVHTHKRTHMHTVYTGMGGSPQKAWGTFSGISAEASHRLPCLLNQTVEHCPRHYGRFRNIHPRSQCTKRADQKTWAHPSSATHSSLSLICEIMILALPPFPTPYETGIQYYMWKWLVTSMHIVEPKLQRQDAQTWQMSSTKQPMVHSRFVTKE